MTQTSFAPQRTEAVRPNAHNSRRSGRLERYGLVLVWALLIAVFAFAAQGFFSWSTFQVIFGSQSVQIIATLAVVFGLAGGVFDLSPVNVVGASAAFLALLNVVVGVPLVLAILLVLAGSVAFGLLNAYFVVKVQIPSIIVTLGTGTLLTGLSIGIAGDSPRTGIEPAFVSFVQTRWFGLPVSLYIAVLAGLLVYLLFDYTTFGRRFQFTGKGFEAAKLAGVKVGQIRTTALIGSSVLASIAGIVMVGATGAANPTSAASYLLPALSAAFLGTTVLRPGTFNVWGSFIATFFLVTGVVGLQFLGLTGWIKDVFYGASLALAVAATYQVARRTGREPTKLQL